MSLQTVPTREPPPPAGRLAIQLIINRELGLNYNENPLQGSFIIVELSDRLEEAVYEEEKRRRSKPSPVSNDSMPIKPRKRQTPAGGG